MLCCPFPTDPKSCKSWVGIFFFFFFFFFLVFKLQFYCKFVTKVFSTGSFSLVVRIVLNYSVFGFTARKVLWQSGCHHSMHILFGSSDFDSRYMYTSFVFFLKKRFPTDRPNLKILSPKGNTTIFFIWPEDKKYNDIQRSVPLYSKTN